MVLVGTQLSVTDNSGALQVNCIKILGSGKRNHSNIGDKLVVSIRRAKSQSKVDIGSVHHGILVRQRALTSRKNGSYIFFDKNSVVLVKKDKKNQINDPIGNRLVGGVTSELRYKKCLKITLLA
jgi:large subunit ribosomal protein L14